ncbi:MAG: hypothetical protein ACTHN5_01350 [Phycisphaerae bacterium]
MIRNALALAALACMGMLAVGCSCNPTKLNVTVSLDDAMRQKLEARKIEVDIVALDSKLAQARWETYSMTHYWEPGDERRESVDSYKMIFDPKNAEPHTLSKTDPHWDKWFGKSGGEMQLYVLALLPGLIDDQPGDKDPRRQILPLGSCRWNSTDVKLLVQKDGIITLTPPKPEKK